MRRSAAELAYRRTATFRRASARRLRINIWRAFGLVVIGAAIGGAFMGVK